MSGTLVSNAQVRYLEEVFTDVNVQDSIIYSQNYDFTSGVLTPLMMDVYTPVGDTATKRPVILLSHNGSFLDHNFTRNFVGLCFAGIKDTSIVELCHRFAKRGYVAISFDYRLGWSFGGDQIARTKTIIQAVYRAMQDSKALVRYLKNDYANSNQYGVDTGKIIIGGSNSGAYVALAAGNLNDTTELVGLKFQDIHGSFIKQDSLGDFDGHGGLAGVNYDNYPGISSRFQGVLSLGGAVGDTSWIQAGEVPVIAFHGTQETSTPYNTGVVRTSSGQNVIEVSGSGDFMPIVERLGNNDIFKPNNFPQGPANRNGQGQTTSSVEGLYPFYGQKFEPWNWYDTACYNNKPVMNTTLTTGTNSPAQGNRYIDTIMGYAGPRLYKLLINPSYGTTGINEVANQIEMALFPNPASTELTVSINILENPIATVQLFDLTGRLVKEITNLNVHRTTINIDDMNNGMYLLSLKLRSGLTATKNLVIAK